jgi:hypothetical protein
LKLRCEVDCDAKERKTKKEEQSRATGYFVDPSITDWCADTDIKLRLDREYTKK